MEISSNSQLIVTSSESKKIETISTEEKKSLENHLDELAGTIGDSFPWVLSGGLAIPLTTGEFYRKHDDIDLGIDEKDFKRFLEVVRPQGYDLFLRPFMCKLPKGKKLDLYQKTSIKKALNSPKTRMRVLRVDTNGRIDFRGNILDYFDVYLHRVEEEMLITRRGGIAIPSAKAIGPPYQTISGRQIIPRGLEYTKILKSKKTKEVDNLDLERIREYERSFA